MTERHDVEVGKTEGLFREVNERIEDLSRGLAAVSDGNMHVVCECGNGECAEQIPVPTAEYEQIRSDPMEFIVIPGHEIPSTETVVARRDGYVVVRKEGDVPEAVAEATDPRP
ncbi:MAG: hypothetical protein ACJ77E_09220 [Gaiellaceae bacterium]